MKGRNVFTKAEADKIRRLIRKKLVADTASQKLIRNEIRTLGFYMTDFSNKKRYTVDDFENAVRITN
jgi:hypothetical protein